MFKIQRAKNIDKSTLACRTLSMNIFFLVKMPDRYNYKVLENSFCHYSLHLVTLPFHFESD